MSNQIAAARSLGLSRDQIGRHNWDDYSIIVYSGRHPQPVLMINRSVDYLRGRPKTMSLSDAFDVICGMRPREINALYDRVMEARRIGLDHYDLYSKRLTKIRMNSLIENSKEAVRIKSRILYRVGFPKGISDPLAAQLSSKTIAPYLERRKLLGGVVSVPKRDLFMPVKSNKLAYDYRDRVQQQEEECQAHCNIM